MSEVGYLVRCLNCGLLWRRITTESNPGGTVFTEDVQLICPKCYSNAFRLEPDPPEKAL